MFIQQNSFFQIGEIISLPHEKFPQRTLEILEYIGSGSEAHIYSAQPHNWDRFNFQIAIRCQLNYTGVEGLLMNKIMTEQNQTNNFNNNLSNYLIRIYDIQKYKGYFIILMEKGQQNLFTYLKQKKELAYIEKLQICLDISKAIQYLHENLIIHRDLKPENFLMFQNKVKLTDFGVSRFNQEFQLKTMGVGTRIFMAPEICFEIAGYDKAIYNEKVDIWSAGCVFYEILKGEELFDEKIQKHRDNPNDVNSKIRLLAIDKQFQDLIISMVTYDYKNRVNIQSIRKTIEELLNKEKLTKNQNRFQMNQNYCPYDNKMNVQFLPFGNNLKPFQQNITQQIFQPKIQSQTINSYSTQQFQNQQQFFQPFAQIKQTFNINDQQINQDTTYTQLLNKIKELLQGQNPKVDDALKQIEEFEKKINEKNIIQKSIDEEFKQTLQKLQSLYNKKNQ